MTNQASKSNPDDSADKPMISRLGMTVLVELLAGAVLAVLGINFETREDPPDTPTPSPTFGYLNDGAPDVLPDESTEPSPEPEPEPTPDPLADVGVGDCVYNLGTVDDFDLEPTDCDRGDFEVVEIFGDSSGTGACDDVRTSLYSYDHGFGSVFCLSYLHPSGDAYYAGRGHCFTRPGDGTYQVTECAEGLVQVIERFWGDRSTDSCSEQEHYSGSIVFEGYAEGQDVKLCTRIQYPDDIGYAQMDTCLYASGPDDSMTFEFADCDWANVYVTGRSPVHRNAEFCEGYGWATWKSDVFPDYAYTVCFAWL